MTISMKTSMIYRGLFILLFSLLNLSTHAQFDGAVGSEGCRAIAHNDPAIRGWATNCELYLGFQDIATSEIVVSYGNAEDAIGAADPAGIAAVSLGDYGSAILSFNSPIINGSGYDFAIFENSFSNTFLELAFVEVSSDGERWVRFPAISNTQTTEQIDGFGHVDPTQIHNLAGKHRAGWGTPFDLEDLRDSSGIDLNNINYVKVIDVIGTINPQYAQYDANGNIINDPYPTNFPSGGFDLAGVAILNGWFPNAIHKTVIENITIFPNPCTDHIVIRNITENQRITLYDIMGGKLDEIFTSEQEVTISMQSYSTGIYLLKVGENSYKISKR